MSTTIYYFSGTGNSLTNARNIAEGLADAEVVSIPHALSPGPQGTVPEPGSQSTSRRIGFVFPTYAYGLPRIVEEFIEKAELPADAYYFAVASNCGIPGPVLRRLARLLRKNGCRLHAGFSVLDESSSLINDPERDGIQRMMISLNRGQFPEKSIDRMDEIIRTIEAEEEHRAETSNRLTNFIGSLLNRMASSSFPTMAKNFWVTDVCSGCGKCVKLCPRGNIRIENGRPVWGDDCEMCHACIQWCDREAVQYSGLTEEKPRYRNPSVTLSDMILQ